MARSFNGSTDEIVVAHDSALNVAAGDFTAACWIYPGLGGSYNTIFDKHNSGGGVRELSFFLDTTTVGFYGVGGSSGDPGTFSPAWTTNEWQHFCWVRSGSSNTVYRNGTSCATFTAGGTTVGTDSLEIGGNPSGGGTNWDGRIAEFALWDDDLTADEVAALAKAFGPPLVRPQSLVLYTPLIGRATTEPDLVGGRSITMAGTSQAEHPRVLNPAPKQRWSKTAGGSTHSKSYSDSLALQEGAITRLANALRTLSESAAAADTASFLRKADAFRTLSESGALRDSASFLRKADAVRVLSESAAITDGASFLRKADALRTLAGESAGVSEAYQRLANALRQYSESAAISDAAFASVVVGPAVTRAFVENLGVADSSSFLRVATALRSYAESLAAQDAALARVANALRTWSETATVQDGALARLASALRVCSESAGLQDFGFARLANSLRAWSESLGVQDSAWTRLFIQLRQFSDSLGISDAAFAVLAVTVATAFDATLLAEIVFRDPGRDALFLDPDGRNRP